MGRESIIGLSGRVTNSWQEELRSNAELRVGFPVAGIAPTPSVAGNFKDNFCEQIVLALGGTVSGFLLCLHSFCKCVLSSLT